MEAAATAGSGGVTSFRSILDKPLTQLTEEDISQITREDCRKFLKEKGMRRPSWNKSQAIQQVISLKALLDDSAAGVLRRFLVSKPPPPPPPPPTMTTRVSVNSVKEPSVDQQPNVVVLESVDYKATAHRGSAVAPDVSVGQMTIFYCGKVNVYDGVPPDKARTIMHLAASPVQLSLDDPAAEKVAFSCPSHIQNHNDEHSHSPHGCPVSCSAQVDVESQASQKVSSERNFEKKRSSCLGTYLSHHARTHTTSGKSTRSSIGSPPESRANKQAKNIQFFCLSQ